MICGLRSNGVAVRPRVLPLADGDASPQTPKGPGGTEHQEEDIDPTQLALDDPITGVELTILDENGTGALEPRAPASPKEMTPAQRAKHNLTHLLRHPGCAICRMCTSPNVFHTASHEHERVIPLRVGDDCFLLAKGDTVLQTCLAMRLYPYKIFSACAVPKKGVDTMVIARIVRFIKDMGLVHFAYRNDREASLMP